MWNGCIAELHMSARVYAKYIVCAILSGDSDRLLFHAITWPVGGGFYSQSFEIGLDRSLCPM